MPFFRPLSGYYAGGVYENVGRSKAMLMMQEAEVAFDPCYAVIWRQMPVGLKVYILFLLAVVIVGFAKLLNVWLVAPPFKKPRDAGSSSYSKLLEISKTSVTQWFGCTVLAWAILICETFGQDLLTLLCDVKTMDRIIVFLMAQDLLGALAATLCVLSFLYLIRWHLISRIGRI